MPIIESFRPARQRQLAPCECVRHDQVAAAYRLLAAVGRLTARALGLPVTPYDFEAHYLDVRDKFWGTGPALN